LSHDGGVDEDVIMAPGVSEAPITNV
jgi:hypothetical protein